MFNVLIDTTNAHFILIFLDQSNNPIYVDVRENFNKKSDLLPNSFQGGLTSIKKNIINLKNIYITIGPGSFTGSRIGLVYAKTIAQFTSAKIYYADSLSFIAKKDFSGNICLDAKSQMCFVGKFKNGKLIEPISLKPSENLNITEYPLNEISKTPIEFLSNFKICENILTLLPFYIKEPNILMRKK